MTHDAKTMLKFKRLQTKISLWAGACLLLTAGVIVAYASITMMMKAEQNRLTAIKNGQEYTAALAKQYANQVQGKLEVALDVARTLAQALSGVKDEEVGLDLDRDEVNGILRTVLSQNADFLGTFTLWEPDAFDGMDIGYALEPGHDESGRFMPFWNRGSDGSIAVEPIVGYDQKGSGDYYQIPKRTQSESIIDPYPYNVQGTPTLMTSLVAPIVVDGTFYGIAGVDFRIEALSLQASIDTNEDMLGVGVELFSHNGTLVFSSFGSDNIGKSVTEISEQGEKFLEQMETHQTLTLEDGEYFSVVTPVTIGQTTTPWTVNVLMPKQRVLAIADEQEAQAFYDIWRMLGLSVLCALVVLTVLWLIVGSIVKPILQSVEVAEQLSEGNLLLEIDVTATDEIGQLQRAMKLLIAQLSGVVTGITSAANQVATGSQAMSSSSAQMSKGATTQAAAAEEASSSMEEMAANIRQNAENALQTEKIAMKAAEDARESGQAVAEAVEAIQEIAGKISIIEDITRQTRMLSLNATIEAARAHEHGKGFAVVASEVRALAQRSQTAALEISDLANASVVVADNAGNMLKRLVPDIQKTAELVQEISAASKEQTTGTAQINRAIQQLDNVTQQNSATSEELSATAEELASQAEMLQHTIAFFQIGTTGKEESVDDDQTHQSVPQSHVESAAAQKTETEARGTSTNPGHDARQHRDERDDEFERV